MTKTLLIASAAAVALFAGSAMAASVNGLAGGNAYGPAGNGPDGSFGGGDGFAQWYIYGSAADFCYLGQTKGNSEGEGSYNVTISTTNNGVQQGSGNSSDTRSGKTSDGTIEITQLQGTNDKQNDWKAVIRMPHSVCNTEFTVTANSANGGLAYTGTQSTSDNHFTTHLDYKVRVHFGEGTGEANAQDIHGSDTQIVAPTQPTAGDFRLIFTSKNSGKYLLSGEYQDNVLIRMQPAVSS